MLVKLGDFIFTLPVNWRDTSSYIYKSVEQKIALTVSFGKTRDGITLEEFVGQQRQELSEAMNDDIEYLTQEQSTVDSLPAVNQSFSFCVQSKKYQEYWSTAYYGENKYLRLSYVGLLKDKMLKATFDHILASSLLSSRSQPEKNQITTCGDRRTYCVCRSQIIFNHQNIILMHHKMAASSSK